MRPPPIDTIVLPDLPMSGRLRSARGWRTFAISTVDSEPTSSTAAALHDVRVVTVARADPSPKGGPVSVDGVMTTFWADA